MTSGIGNMTSGSGSMTNKIGSRGSASNGNEL